jgi:hypothetical protein
VPIVNRNAAFGVGALIGAAAALVWDRRTRLQPAPAPTEGRRELREKLAETQQPEPPQQPAAPPEPQATAPKPPPPEAKAAAPPPPEAKAAAPPPPEAKAAAPPPPPGPPPADEFEAMRRRIHEEGKAAAEEMRRAPEEAS